MKKILTLLFLISFNLHASNEKEELREKLNKLDGFYASYYQSVSDKENNQVSETNGNLIFKQPNKFSLSSNYPNEELVLSNGETLWWYDPFVEQVTIYDAKKLISNNPFTLLVSNEDTVWNNFTIEKDNNNYVIKAKDIMNSQLDKLIISFKNEVINQIIIFDKTEQIINYSLSDQEINKNKKYEFNFKIKDDITVDDQR